MRGSSSRRMTFGAQNVLTAVAERARKLPADHLEDAMLQTLTYRKLMVGWRCWRTLCATPFRAAGALACCCQCQRHTVVILALWRLGQVPAMMNFSSGTTTLLACANLAGLKHIVTSRAFLERTRLNVDALVKAGLNLVYLEDVRADITGSRKFLTLLRHVSIRPPRFPVRHPPPRP
jgi:acyl-[acyl-carrier-protein]-phospholipid O-acyltransferase/long-chain-fatty-acid--[acyl-carrier-protein] ligase